MPVEKSPTRSLAEATESVGLTWRHWVYFFVIAFILLCDGMDVTIVSHIFPSLIKEWGVDVGGGIALVVSGGFIAMGIGAIVAGRLADVFGRKTILATAAMLFGAATALGGTSSDLNSFTVWRWIACLGMGAAMAGANALISELVPKQRRSAMLAIAYAGVGLGTSVGASLAGSILPTEGWRTLIIVAGLLPVACAILAAIVLPESPAYYAAKGSIDKAKRALRRLSPKFDAELIDFSLVDDQNASSETPQSGALSKLVSKKFAPVTALVFIFGFLTLGTQLTVVQYLPTILQQPNPGLDTVQSSTIMGLYGLASTVGGLLLGAILAKWSRFIVFGTLLVLSAVIITIVGILPDPAYSTLLIVFVIYAFIVPTALGPSRAIMAAAAYPTSVRATGIGTAEMAGRVGSAVCGGIGGVLLGAGITMGGFFLTLLIPIVLLIGSLTGLRFLDRGSASPVDEDETAGTRTVHVPTRR